MDLREYKYNRSRYGFGGSFDYKLGDASLIYVRGLFSEFLDFGKRWVYTLNDNTPPPGSAVPSSTTEQRQGNYLVSSLLLGGNHVMTKWWLNWGASASRSRMKSPLAGGESITYFTYMPPGTDPVVNPPTSNCVYNPAANKTAYRPQWSSDCFAEAYNPSNYQLAEVADSAHGKAAQLNLAAFGSAARSYHLGSHPSTFEFGAKIRNAHKFDDSYELDYFPLDPTTAPRMDMFITGLKDPNYYGGSYKFGPAASWEQVNKYLIANLGAFSLTSTQGGNSNNFDLVERITAGYIMNTTDFGRFRVIAGLRIEGTNDNTVSFDQTAQPFPCLCAKGGGSYVNPLPSASVQYRINDSSDVRFVYSRALSRPDPQTLTTSISLDTSTTPFTYTVGNSSLKPELANNYDLLYQRFLPHVGLLQLGTFYKSLYDPVVQILTHPTTGPYAGFQLNTPVNGGSGHIWGFEASFQQHFTYLPGLLKGLGISANYSYAASLARNVNPDNRYENPPLLRQAPNTWNISPTFDRGPLSLRLGFAYNGPFIFQYQYTDRLPDGTPNIPPGGLHGGLRGPSGDIYQYSHFQVDMQASYAVKRSFKFIFAALNLNNEPWGFYVGSPQFVLQREYYNPTYTFGVRWDLPHAR